MDQFKMKKYYKIIFKRVWKDGFPLLDYVFRISADSCDLAIEKCKDELNIIKTEAILHSAEFLWND